MNSFRSPEFHIIIVTCTAQARNYKRKPSTYTLVGSDGLLQQNQLLYQKNVMVVNTRMKITQNSPNTFHKQHHPLVTSHRRLS